MPGQTRGDDTLPSRGGNYGFNGGPDNCPARRGIGRGRTRSAGSSRGRLQWRAGQLPGQTWVMAPHVGPAGVACFNGGPDNCPARLLIADLIRMPCARPAMLQWRAGQLPGQTRSACVSHHRRPCACSSGSLQWRAGQLPGQTQAHRCGDEVLDPCLQWRAGQLPGQTLGNTQWFNEALGDVRTWLQWRAGQLPGQTGVDYGCGAPYQRVLASMEGRTIARPDDSDLAPCRMATRTRPGASMEGRTIARPDCLGLPHLPLDIPAASMEGRTIARPDSRCERRTYTVVTPQPCFNGGPDNCPARHKLREVLGRRVSSCELQWRAGQLPGQTGIDRLARSAWSVSEASMEGRTIARPDLDVFGIASHTRPRSCFNGGPDNCPARPAPCVQQYLSCVKACFNGGPDNCPARPHALRG